MIANAVEGLTLSLLTPTGTLLGTLGSLYLAYDFFGRQPKILHRCVWIFSSGLLIAVVLSASYMFLFGVQRLADGYTHEEIWRVALVAIPLGFVIQFAFFSPPPHTLPPVIVWRNMLFPVIFSSIGLVGLGAVATPQGSSPVEALIFAFPAVLVVGILNGFSPALQWWLLHLPEKRVAGIGALLILIAFILIFVQYMLNFLGILPR